MPLQPPVAPKVPTERVHHGDVFVDQYEWMRDKENTDVIAHLEAENAFTDEQTGDLAVLREQLFEEIRKHTKETDLSVPVRRGDWWYYSRTVEGKQYSIHCRVPIAAADDWTPPDLEKASDAGLPGEVVLLDSNVEAEGHDYFSLGSFDLNADGSRLVYAVDTVGDERYTLRVRDVHTGENLADEVPNTFAGAIFNATGRYVFYTTVDDAWRPDSVWRHTLGTAASDDVRVHHEPDERFWIGIDLSRSRKYLIIEAGSKITSEAMLLPADDPTGEFRVVWPRREGVEYSVEHAVLHGEDRLLIVHNDNAVDFELVDVAVDAPQADRRVLVPHTVGTRIDGVDAFAGHLVLEYRRDALPRVAIVRLAGFDTPQAATQPAGVPSGLSSERRRSPRIETDAALEWHEIAFDEQLFSVGAAGNPEWTQPAVRLSYASFVTPATVYDYDIASGSLAMLKRQPVLGGYAPELYEQRREWATAKDGTRIPISLVYRADMVTDGEPSPTLLYGYGSYEHSIDPGFSIPRISLLNRGVVFAVAHIRGGGELGRSWYEQGKTLAKRNTFTDFVACAEHLIDTGATTADRLVAEGGSAGGLLVGAAANIAPGTFAGILAVVPFVDPLTSILDPSLPLTVIEWDEWGDPLHDAEVYHLMKAYSPYENVHETTYPQILAVTSLNDTRVLYVEPAKWVARLREVGAPVLLRTEMSAGHGGVSGRYEAWHKKAFEYAWVLRALGLHLSA